jgi:hypothetical membrane protein
MMTTTSTSPSFATSSFVATIAITATAISVLALLVLHFVSPEYQPSWRMVSEYGNGHHAWLLTVMFVAWGVAYWAIAVAVWPITASWTGRIGSLFLIAAGIGAVMGGLFDVNHRWHGLAFGIGVPSLTVAALVVTPALRRASVHVPLWPSHLSWISVVMMGLALLFFTRGLAAAGVPFGPQAPPLRELPPGVTAWHGWTNRLVFAASYLWLATTAQAVRSIVSR